MTWHETEIRIRYQETDRMGVAYYANHFVWFELARTELFRSVGFSYRRLEEDDRLHLMVVEASCKYKAPVTYDDVVTVRTRISKAEKTSLSFEYKIFCAERLVAGGSTSHVFTNMEGRPVKIPQSIKAALIA